MKQEELESKAKNEKEGGDKLPTEMERTSATKGEGFQKLERGFWKIRGGFSIRKRVRGSIIFS